MFQLRQDNHTAFVIGLEEFESVPVLIHHVGHYPSILGVDGKQVDQYIEVQFWTDVNGRDSYAVRGIAGYRHGRQMCLRAGGADTLDDARTLFPAAAKLIADAPALYDGAGAIINKYAAWAGPLTREAYETLAAELGFEAKPDPELSKWGDFDFPAYGIHILPELLTHQRRAYTYEDEKEAGATVRRKAALQQKITSLAELRKLPVLRTEKRFVPFGRPDEFVERKMLFTVIERKRRTITEDDPSIYGSHLLGYEGSDGELLTLEVRGE